MTAQINALTYDDLNILNTVNSREDQLDIRNLLDLDSDEDQPGLSRNPAGAG
jgi:hypothetical protein